MGIDSNKLNRHGQIACASSWLGGLYTVSCNDTMRQMLCLITQTYLYKQKIDKHIQKLNKKIMELSEIWSVVRLNTAELNVNMIAVVLCQ